MAEFDFTLEPMEDRDLPERQERCQKAIRTIRKAVFMRLLICGILIFVVLKTPMELWTVGLMLLVLVINIVGTLPLTAELKKRRAEWKQLLEEEEQ